MTENRFPTRKRILIAAVIFAALVLPASFGQSPNGYPWQYFWQKSLASYKAKDYAAYLENSRKAVETGPQNHPTLLFHLARAYSLTGDKQESAKWLEKAAVLGFGSEALAGGDFSYLRDSNEYSGLKKRLENIEKPMLASKAAVTVNEPDLIPESVAYDGSERSFYVGSLYKQKVVKIDGRGKRSDFVAEAADGLGAVVGIKIDARQRVLWVLNNVAPEMKNFEKAREGFGMLHKYDLKTGKLIKKYELANKPRPHLLNDLVITRGGDLYISDSFSSVVHVLRAGGGDQLEVFAELAPYSYPNGIALSKDESKLYVADLNGISVIDRRTGKTAPLAHEETIALAGIDGMYLYENSLLAIQNFESPHRVVRFDLNETGDRVIRARVLDSNHPFYKIPTTGTLDGRNFYYIANSQLRSFDENGKLFAPEKLQDVKILKLKL